MGEHYPIRTEEIKLTISHDEAIAKPERRDDYRTQRSAARANGQKVWEIRSFQSIDADEEALVTYDYFFKEIARGYLEGNDEVGYDVRAAMFKAEMTLHGPELIQIGMVNLSLEGPKDNFYEAKNTLEDYVHGTVPPEVVIE